MNYEGKFFSLSNKEAGDNFGVVYHFYRHGMYIGIFGSEDDGKITNFLEKEPILIGWTNDALFHHGRWQVEHSVSLDKESFLKPYYKVMINEEIWITDFMGNEIRRAEIEEENILEYRKIIAPIRYQNAIESYHINGKIDTKYSSISFKSIKTKLEIFLKLQKGRMEK